MRWISPWLVAGALALIAMLVFSFTPLAWVWGGRESESYPEIAAFGLGVPLAIIALSAAALALWTAPRGMGRRTSILKSLCGTALLGCGVLIAGFFIPATDPDWLGAAWSAAFVAMPLLALALVVIGVSAFMGRPQRR